MREDRGTTESVHKWMLYNIRGKLLVFQMDFNKLTKIGPAVHWRITKWGIERAFRMGFVIPSTLQKGMRSKGRLGTVY